MAIPVMVALGGNAAGLTSALGSANGAMSAFGGSAAQMGTAVGGALASMNALLTGMGISAIKSAADFETVMTRVYTSSNITKESLAGMSQGVLELSTHVGYAANELGNAMKYVVSSGFEGADAVNVLRVAAQGAQVGVGDLGATSKALATIMYDLHMPASQATSAMESLMASVRIGQVELGDLSTAMANIMPVAISAGLGLNEIAAAMATMTAQGTPAVNAGTQLRMTILQLERPTQKAAKAMENFGLDATDVSTKLGERGLSGTLQLLTNSIDNQLGTSLSGMDKQLTDMSSGSLEEFQAAIDALPASQQTAIGALADMLGGVKSLQGAIQLTGSHTQDFADNIKKVTEASKNAGTDVSKFGDMAETTGVKWENFKNQLKEIAIQLGDMMLPAAKKVLDGLNKVSDWFSNHPWAIKAALVLIGTAMGITATIAAILGIAILGLAMPFLLIGALIAGVVLAIIWLKNHMSDLPHYFMMAVHGIWNALVMAYNATVMFLTGIWNFFYSIWTRIVTFLWTVGAAIWATTVSTWNTVWGFLVGLWTSIWNLAVSIWTSVMNFFFNIWISIVNATVSAWNSILNFVTSAFTGCLNMVISVGASIVSAVVSIFNSALSSASGFIGSFVGVGADIIRGVWNGVMSMAGSLASAAASVVRGALNAAKSAIGIGSPSRDFHEQVGEPIVQGIARGIRAARPMIDAAVQDAVRGPLNDEYQFAGQFSANGLSGNLQGAAQLKGQGVTVNINADFSGNFYGQGGARQAAIDIQRELLRIQKSSDLGFIDTARRQLGV